MSSKRAEKARRPPGKRVAGPGRKALPELERLSDRVTVRLDAASRAQLAALSAQLLLDDSAVIRQALALLARKVADES
jgi:hypothetical protein